MGEVAESFRKGKPGWPPARGGGTPRGLAAGAFGIARRFGGEPRTNQRLRRRQANWEKRRRERPSARRGAAER